ESMDRIAVSVEDVTKRSANRLACFPVQVGARYGRVKYANILIGDLAGCTARIGQLRIGGAGHADKRTGKQDGLQPHDGPRRPANDTPGRNMAPAVRGCARRESSIGL